MIQRFLKSWKQLSVNIERQLKSELACPVCAKGMKLKIEMVQEQWLGGGGGGYNMQIVN